MNSLRLAPLNFDALPNSRPLHCELPPISSQAHVPFIQYYGQYSHQPNIPSLPVLPSLSPLLIEMAPLIPTRCSPVATYRQQSSRTSSPASSSTSVPPIIHSLPSAVQPSCTAFESLLPTNLPPAPVKSAIQTPKGVREVYTCPFPTCNRVSSEHSNMKAHMRLHTGERPYICRVASCRKSFRWKSSLTYHERALHSNSRPYQCLPCRKSFVEKRKLRLHHQLCPAVRAAHAEVLQYGKIKVPVQQQSLRLNWFTCKGPKHNKWIILYFQIVPLPFHICWPHWILVFASVKSDYWNNRVSYCIKTVFPPIGIW